MKNVFNLKNKFNNSSNEEEKIYQITMKIMFTIIISMFFLSCDPGLINNYVVENKSDYLIESNIRLINGFRTLQSADSIQRILIKPNSNIEIANYGEIRNAHDKNQYFLEAFDSISLQINEMKILKKIKNRNSWNYRVINEGLLSMDEVEYKLVIENSDLKKSNE
ncbi:MAG: hypothetical protein N4A45_13195 [Flavobacteriales bacterium]|nr:hypothetical protein [Flavobacteriales bacterium]